MTGKAISASSPYPELALAQEYGTLNIIAGEVSSEGLEKLKASELVESIFLDPTMQTTLQEAVPQVHADRVMLSLDGTDILLTGETQRICLLDTGVDTTHPDLEDIVVDQACFCSISDLGAGGCCPNGQAQDTVAPDDSLTSHGTHGAGILAADGIVRGIAPGAEIVAVKVCDFQGKCRGADILAGIDYCISRAVENNISIILGSLSDGGAYTADDCPVPFDTSFEIARQFRMTPVFAAGNNFYDDGISYPACSPYTIAVGASDENSSIAGFSNRGDLLDVLAPGTGIYSTKRNGQYSEQSGTSSAAAIVAGAIALLKQRNVLMNVTKNNAEIKETLKFSGKNLTGFPLLEVAAAIRLIDSVVIEERSDIASSANNQTGVFTVAAVGCGTLNTSTNLDQDITTGGTCFTVGANNIVINGSGYTIKGGATGTGIDTNGFDNITIKNFAGINNFTNGISLTGTVNSTIFNNTIITATADGIDATYGVVVQTSSDSNNISSNIINATGVLGTGINVLTSSSNTFMWNIINASGADGYGIIVQAAGETAVSNTIDSNNVRTLGLASHGIYLPGGTTNNRISSNNITVADAIAINIDTNSHGNNVTNNIMTVSGPGGYSGIVVTASNVTVSGNIITVLTTGGGNGIVISGGDSSNVNLSSNRINATGSSSSGIQVSGSRHRITSNIINTSAAGGYGISLSTSSHNILASNIIKTTNASTAYGIYLVAGSNNTFTNDNINATASNDIRIGLTGSANFTNVTFDRSDVAFDAGNNKGNLAVQWYLDVVVKDAQNANLQGANVTIKNVSGSLLFNNQTNLSGIIPQQMLIEFIQNSSSKIIHTPHTINVSKDGFKKNATVLNLSTSGSTLVTLTLFSPFGNCGQYDGNQSQCLLANCIWESDINRCSPNFGSLECDEFCGICATQATCTASSKGCVWESGGFCHENYTAFTYGTGGTENSTGYFNFEPYDCFKQPDKCDSKFDVNGNFYKIETLCSDSVDNDLDGATDCSDIDCSLWSVCSGSYNASNDTTPPKITNLRAEPSVNATEIFFSISEPTNATLSFYNRSSTCAALNSTLTEPNLASCSLDDYALWHTFSLDSESLFSLAANTTYYYKASGYDRAGLQFQTACLNFTTKASAETYQVRFFFDQAVNIDTGSGYNSYNFSSTAQNFSRQRDVRLKIGDLEFSGVDLSGGKSINFSTAFSSGTSTHGTAFKAFNSSTWLETAQNLGLKPSDNVTLALEGTGGTLYKCDDSGANCIEMAECVTLVTQNATHKTYSVAVAAGFSSYTLSAPSSPSGGGANANATKLSSNKIEIGSSFTVEPVQIVVEAPRRKVRNASFTIKNTGTTTQSLTISIDESLLDLIVLRDKNLVLAPGESKEISLSITPFDRDAKVYEGDITIAGGTAEQRVHVIVTVVQQLALFDMRVSLADTRVVSGTTLPITTEIFSVGDFCCGDVVLKYTLVNEAGDSIVNELQIVAVKNSTFVVKPLAVPEDIPPGNYHILVVATYNGEEQALTDIWFEVVPAAKLQQPYFDFGSYLPVVLVLGVVMIISGIVGYSVLKSRAKIRRRLQKE